MAGDEYLDLLNDRGEYLGKQKLRSLVHRDGDWHYSIHVWIINDNNEFLIQKRSSNREISKGSWTVSASGHVKAGTDLLTAAVNEAKEEVGVLLRPEELRLLTVYKRSKSYPEENIVDREFNPVFVVHKRLTIDDVEIDGDEVADARFVGVKELQRMIESGEIAFKPDNKKYHMIMFDYFSTLS